MEQKDKVIYAGDKYEVIYKGDRVFHLRSIRDPKLIIHCSIKSEFLKDIKEKDGTDN